MAQQQDRCPHCDADLRGEPIPAKQRGSGPTAPTHFSRRMGFVEHEEMYDGVDGILYWQCPDCGGRWHRWPESTWQRAVAERYVAAENGGFLPRSK